MFERVGGSSPIKADVRIIASTKRNLLDRIGEGAFREDLYYRLDVLRINIPPLSERLEDVPLLAEHLLGRIAGKPDCPIAPGAMELLLRHEWPGNVRELHHTLERAYLIGGGALQPRFLRPRSAGPTRTSGCRSAVFRRPSTMPRSNCCRRPCAIPAATKPPPPPRWT